MKKINAAAIGAAIVLAVILSASGCKGKADPDVKTEPAGSASGEAAASVSAAASQGPAAKLTDTSSPLMLTYNGRPVSVDEFRLFILLTSSGDKDDTLEYMLYALGVIEHAKAEGITVSDEAMVNINEDIATLDEYTTSTAEQEAYFDPLDIPRDKLVEWLSTDYYAMELYEKYTADVTVTDEADFESGLESYYETRRRDYTELLFNYIYTDTKEAADEALEFINGGGDFEEAVKKYSGQYYEEDGVVTMDMREINVSDEWAEIFLAMEEGEVWEPLDSGDGYLIVKIVKNNRPPMSEVADVYREEYIDNKKYAVYDGIIAKWREEADVSVNEDEYNSFEMR